MAFSVDYLDVAAITVFFFLWQVSAVRCHEMPAHLNFIANLNYLHYFVGQ